MTENPRQQNYRERSDCEEIGLELKYIAHIKNPHIFSQGHAN